MAFDGPTELKKSPRKCKLHRFFTIKVYTAIPTETLVRTSPYRALPPSSGPVLYYYPRSTSCIKHTFNHKSYPVTQFPRFDSSNYLKRCGNVYAPPVSKSKGKTAACGLYSRVPHVYHTEQLLFPYTSLFGLCNADKCCL